MRKFGGNGVGRYVENSITPVRLSMEGVPR